MNKHIRAILVDDETDSLELLQLQLGKYCDDVTVVGAFSNPLDAERAIRSEVPDVVFTDIEMPLLNGLDLIKNTLHLGVKVIFITAYNQYASKAFRFNAVDYLLKPVDADELKVAISRVYDQPKPAIHQINNLQGQIRGARIDKIAVSSQQGITFIGFGQIIYIEACNNYSRIYVDNGGCHVISKTLKDVQEVLEESHFLRIHRQYVVNLHRVSFFNRNDSLLVLDNGTELPVAKNQKDRLIERFNLL